jgi:hypothetical protein
VIGEAAPAQKSHDRKGRVAMDGIAAPWPC